MKKTLLIAALLSMFNLHSSFSHAQSGIYIPSPKPAKSAKSPKPAKPPKPDKDVLNTSEPPATFHLLLSYQADDSTFAVDDLDLLDSAFSLAFDINNPNYYTINVESYAHNDTLGRYRAQSVVRYFSQRCHAPFPIRLAHNTIRCSCHGDSVETIRYEVPVSTAVYDFSLLPQARRHLFDTIPLDNSVLVTFTNNPEECVGPARGCFLPASDSIVRGYYASLFLPRASVYSLAGTKSQCPSVKIEVEDHLDYRQTVERYSLIPHPKQLLVQAGYIVLKSNYARQHGECELQQPDSIYIRIPATPEQVAAKLKFFAKVQTSRGLEYKALPTRKLPGKGDLVLQAPISVLQFDTIYLGKRISDDELKKYFYPVDSPTEAAAFAVGDKYFVAFHVDKHGRYVLKQPLRDLFRIVPEQEEDVQPQADRKKTENPDEIIE